MLPNVARLGAKLLQSCGPRTTPCTYWCLVLPLPQCSQGIALLSLFVRPLACSRLAFPALVTSNRESVSTHSKDSTVRATSIKALLRGHEHDLISNLGTLPWLKLSLKSQYWQISSMHCAVLSEAAQYLRILLQLTVFRIPIISNSIYQKVIFSCTRAILLQKGRFKKSSKIRSTS